MSGSRGFDAVANGVTMETPGLLGALAERLVQPRPDCMLWPDPTHQGYGRIQIDGREMRVHRVFWELERGPIPDDMVIDHLCRIRSCCNTEHMELVTQAENARRGVHLRRAPLLRWPPSLAAHNAAKTHCIHGHEFTPENTRIRPTGHRSCRECDRARARKYYANKAS